jgi:hypothetical protein
MRTGTATRPPLFSSPMSHILGGFEPRHFSLIAKWLIAAGGMLLLMRQVSAPSGTRTTRKADRALAVLAVLALLSWWHTGALHFGSSFHPWEFFHYYLGSKYSNELGYTRLYDCTAAVESEQDPSYTGLHRWVRNLTTNVIEPVSPAALNPDLCRSRFSPARWQEFTHDVLFFRQAAGPARWPQMQTDHGYNATPVWNGAGYLLANTGPATKRQMTLLALLDPALIIVMWATVWWAFGWRATAVAALWWGTNFPARYSYIGAAFLRSDFLVTAVTGIALARRGYMMLAGAAIGWSALLRIFPAFLTSGAFFRLLTTRYRTDPSTRQAFQLLAGACLAALVLIPFSLLVPRGNLDSGVSRWRGFVANSDKHLSGSYTNMVGLKSLVSYTRSGYNEVGEFWVDGPGDAWESLHHQAFERRKAVYWIAAALFVVLLTLAVRQQPYWVALILGVGLIPILADLSCYYYGILLVYGLLWDRYPWAGVGVVALSVFTLCASSLSTSEMTYTVISAGVIVYVFVVTAGVAWSNVAARRELLAVEPTA